MTVGQIKVLWCGNDPPKAPELKAWSQVVAFGEVRGTWRSRAQCKEVRSLGCFLEEEIGTLATPVSLLCFLAAMRWIVFSTWCSALVFCFTMVTLDWDLWATCHVSFSPHKLTISGIFVSVVENLLTQRRIYWLGLCVDGPTVSFPLGSRCFPPLCDLCLSYITEKGPCIWFLVGDPKSSQAWREGALP
jgi:hypothetical protein